MSQVVFISYAARDKKVADAVCRALEDNRVRCWIAPRDVLPGMEYAAAIIDALNSCRVFLVIFSETSNSSPQVAREVERAISKGRTILTFRIDNTALSKAMEYYLSDRHWLDASSGKFTGHLENLVKAVKALEAAMTPAFIETDIVAGKSSEVESAEDKRQLEVLLAKADTAIESARLDEASEFLQAALAIKPDEAVESKLTQVGSQQRTAGMVELKTRAQGLEGAERFEEAMDVWNEYLALKPDDHEEVEKILQDLSRAARIAGDYEKSLAAIRAKQYDRAIGLLQRIISQAPDYKSSSRLLVEAVQAKKNIPFLRRYLAFEVTGAVAFILLGVFFGPKLWGAISSPMQPSPLSAKTNSPTVALPSPTPTQQANSTAKALNPIPVLPADLVNLEPVLAYVKNKPPDFADDFSKTNPAWNPFQEGITINDGTLRMTMQSGTPTEKIGPFSRDMNTGNDFWLEFDFFFEGSSADAYLNEGFSSTGNGSGTNWGISIDLAKQDWFIGLSDNSIKKSGHLDESLKGKWVHLLVVYSNAQVVGFLNGELLGYLEGIPKSGNETWIIGTTTGQAEIWLDNVKFWNLDSLNTSTPESVPDFITSIQTTMTGQAPSFADDFTKANDSWGQFPPGAALKDGVLQMLLEAGTPSEKIGLYSPYLNAANFGLEYDFYFNGASGNTFFMDVGFTSLGDINGINCDATIELQKPDWLLELSDQSIEKRGIIAGSLLGKWSHLQIIFYKSRVVFFLDGIPLGQIEGISKSRDEIWIVARTATGKAEIWLDNVKFWDLDKIPALP